MINLMLPVLILLVSLFGHTWDKAGSPAMSQSRYELVVLAESGDPYYSLAEEIAAAENAPLTGSLQEAMACRPVFLLWVVSPGFLSDAAMIDFALAMQKSPSTFSPGIITASTLDRAARSMAAAYPGTGNESYCRQCAQSRRSLGRRTADRV